jgi:hypothetical protein
VRQIVLSVTVILGSVLLAGTVQAATFVFTGTVTSVTDPLGLFADAQIGNSVSGYFSYSTNPADWGFVGTSGEYQNYQTTDPNTAVWDLLAKVTTATTTITNKDIAEPRRLSGVQLRDDPTTGATLDSLAILSYQGNIFLPTPVVTEVNLGFVDAGGGLFTGASPPSEIAFANADQAEGTFIFLVDTNGDGNRETSSFVRFSIDSVTAVPEPTAMGIWAAVIGLGVIASRRRQLAR